MDKDDSSAMLELADKYYFGTEVEKDLATALHWYLQAAKNGNIEAITQVGLMYYNGIGTTVDYNAAAKWLNRHPLNFLCDGPAVYTLAEMYFYGRGVKQDYLRAFDLYQFATINGYNFNAWFRMGEMYEYGYGVEVDNQRAIECYIKAANGGNVVAMSKLGLIYETGEIVEQDYSEAKHWYALAAYKGNAFAAAKLAEILGLDDDEKNNYE